MSTGTVNIGTVDPDHRPPPMRRLARGVPWWPATSVAVAIAVTLVSYVPSWHFPHWTATALVAGALTSFVLAAPVHRAAWTPSAVHAVASLGITAGWGWTAYRVATDASQTPLVLGAAPAALAVVGHSLLRHSGASIAKRWARPHLLLVAITTGVGATVGGLLGGTDRALQAAVATLIAAAPSALMTAPSTALLTARRTGERIGARPRDLHVVTTAAHADTVVLPKDGTVTTGDLTVTSVDPIEPDHDRNLRWFAGALEHAFGNRIGRAIAQLSGRGRLSNVTHHDGRGVSGSVDRHPVRVGDPAWLGVTAPDSIWTTVAVEVDARPLGTITVADQMRPHAEEDVARLSALGLDVILVSAEDEARSAHVAKASGIRDVRLAATGEVCAELAAAGRAVIVAGDQAPPAGVTSFGPVGSDIELDDCAVERVAGAIGWARSLASRAALASRLAFGCGAVGVVLAAAGVLTPALAVAFAAFGTAATALVLLGPTERSYCDDPD